MKRWAVIVCQYLALTLGAWAQTDPFHVSVAWGTTGGAPAVVVSLGIKYSALTEVSGK